MVIYIVFSLIHQTIISHRMFVLVKAQIIQSNINSSQVTVTILWDLTFVGSVIIQVMLMKLLWHPVGKFRVTHLQISHLR